MSVISRHTSTQPEVKPFEPLRRPKRSIVFWTGCWKHLDHAL
jgi:hypothetical protein